LIFSPIYYRQPGRERSSAHAHITPSEVFHEASIGHCYRSYSVHRRGIRTTTRSESPVPNKRSSTISRATGVSEGDSKPSVWAPAEKNDHEARIQVDGRRLLFVVIHSDYKTPEGNGTGTSFLGYDPQDKVYTYDEFNSTGKPYTPRASWTETTGPGPVT